MSSTSRPRRGAGGSRGPDGPGGRAVEPAWIDAFVTELGSREVPGEWIGDALAEVEAHCADTGQSAAEAFGDPIVYARGLDLPATPDARERAGIWRVLAGGAAGVVGMLATLRGAAAWHRGLEVQVSVGSLVMLGLLLLLFVVLGAAPGAVLRGLARAGVIGGAIGGAAFVALLVAVLLLLPRVAMSVAPPPVLVVGVIGLLLSCVVFARELPRDTDAVGARNSLRDGSAGRGRLAWPLTVAVFPIVTAVMVVLDLLLAR